MIVHLYATNGSFAVDSEAVRGGVGKHFDVESVALRDVIYIRLLTIDSVVRLIEQVLVHILAQAKIELIVKSCFHRKKESCGADVFNDSGFRKAVDIKGP